MAIWQNSSSRSDATKPSIRKSRKAAQSQRLRFRSLHLEPFEERTLFAIGPSLVGIIEPDGTVLAAKQILHAAPTQLTLRFDSAIDPSTLSTNGVAAIQFMRSVDGTLGNSNDAPIGLGFVGLGDNPTDVVVRFAGALPTDLYRVSISGSLKSSPIAPATVGLPFNGGSPHTQDFTLQLGPQVVSIVPQPVTRGANLALSQNPHEIDVYFNANDPLMSSDPTSPTSVTNPNNYELIRTAGTASEADDTLFHPTSVTYDATSGKATLLFDPVGAVPSPLDTPDLYRLRIGNSDPLALPPITISSAALSNPPGSSFDTAASITTPYFNQPPSGPQGTQSIDLSGTIGGSPVSVIYPGGNNEPGQRNIPSPAPSPGAGAIATLPVSDGHFQPWQDPTTGALHVLPDGTTAPDRSGTIPVFKYNFQSNYGTVLGQPVFNAITETQKQRVREALSYWANSLGVEFEEVAVSPNSPYITTAGFTIATGDVRAISTTVPAGSSQVPALSSTNEVVMSGAVNWGNSEAGGLYFGAAMGEIGHLLGLGNDFDAPPLTIVGTEQGGPSFTGAEPVFPGDADILYGQYLHPPTGNDINVFNLTVPAAGQVNFETFAERIQQVGNEVQQVALLGATGGTYTLSLTINGITKTTGAIAFNATALTVQNSLSALSNVGAGNVSVTGSNGGPYAVTFLKTLAVTSTPLLSANGVGLSVGGTVAVSSAPSQLDTVISVYDSNHNLLARNDDYYGKDSFVQLQLAQGNYFVAVTSTGNTHFDPTIANSGFGGTTQGAYQLRVTFAPTPTAGIEDLNGVLLDGDDDGSPGGVDNFWFRVASTAQTIFVDKQTGVDPQILAGSSGSVTAPFNTIAFALLHASPNSVVRVEGNGGADNNLATTNDNLSYNVGFDSLGNALSDGSTLKVPLGVTLMIDAGAIIKLHGANIDVGSSAVADDRHGGALQVLGTTAGPVNEIQQLTLGAATGGTYTLSLAFNGVTATTNAIAFSASASTVQSSLAALANIGSGNVLVTGSNGGPYNITFQNILGTQPIPLLSASSALTGGKAVAALIVEGGHIGTVYFTSYYDSTIGKDPGPSKNNTNPVATGNWGGLVFRQDSDFAAAGIFLNYVDNAQITYGGGQVIVNSQPQVFDPIHVISSRPTITFNTIANNADAAMSADPNSFQETEFQGPAYNSDYSRVGPMIHGNVLSNNSINGLFVRIRTDPNTHQVLDPLTVSARFTATDIVYVIEENLVIQGQPGGFFIDATGKLQDRQSARLAIDPGVIVKLSGARIETQIGAQFIAEGTAAKPIIFTATFDGTFGAGGTFDTTNNNNAFPPLEGSWGGLFFGPLSIGSVDHALIQYGGGRTTIEGGFDNFDAVEIHQAQVRITNSTLQHNAPGGGGDRDGRGTATPAIIFVIGAQPVILNNVIQNNDTTGTVNPQTAAISINVNSLNSTLVNDWGRSRGNIDLQGNFNANTGPLIHGNELANNPINGMIVRGGEITTNVVWDDTDIVHVLGDQVIAGNEHSTSGTIRLQSSAAQSLVVKLLGATAGFTANGQPLDITDRIGGTLQVVGLPNHPVVLTSLFDTTVGAGFTPSGKLQTDTANQKGVTSTSGTTFPNSGPVMIDGANRDAHGSSSGSPLVNQGGWQFIQTALNYAFAGSRNTTLGSAGILVIGVQPGAAGTTSLAQQAITSAAGALASPPALTFVTGTSILTANFSQFKMIYIPSDAEDVDGGITDADLALLAQRKSDLQTYVDVTGGGLVALTENSAANPYAWLALPDAISIQQVGGNNLVQTAAFTAAFTAAGLTLTNQQVSAGTPWLNDFTGPPGFDRLQPWLVDQTNGDVVTLGAAPASGGIGPRVNTAPQPGDWAGLTLDTLSNDTNVAVVNEVEQGFSAVGDTNNLPTTAQFLGTLAANSNSGDDTNRLGFDIHGSISQAYSAPRIGSLGSSGDVDVYSFQATAGSTVWFDIGHTASALDSVIELIDSNGNVIAASNDSLREQQTPSLLLGDPSVVKPLAPGFTTAPNSTGIPSPFSNTDFNSTNPFDAGMRVELPQGPSGPVSTYFIRVLANNGPSGTDAAYKLAASSPTSAGLTQGLTKGAYELQIRLQNAPQVAGSTVQSADIRYAATGIQVIGKPEHSPLLGDTASSSNPHSTLETAQDLGNLAASDQGAISVAGNLTSSNSVDWFKLNVNYDLVQAINGFSDGLKTFGAMFTINYADGLNRPDTTISIFDDHGNLILVGRDSTTPDGQPRPGTGADLANLSHGSYGALDPTIGSVQLPAGGPLITLPNGTTVGARTYYVAVSSSASLPTVLDATFVAGPTPAHPTATGPTDPLVRLEPIDSTARIVDDRIGSTGSTTTAQPSQQLFPGTTPVQLNASATPFTLGDVPLFVNDSIDLSTVDGFTGSFETHVTNLVAKPDPSLGQVTGKTGNAKNLPDSGLDGASNLAYTDIAFRDDGRLMTVSQQIANSPFSTDINDQIHDIDPSDGTLLYKTAIGVKTFVETPMSAPPTWQQVANDPGLDFTALTFMDPLMGTKESSINAIPNRQLFAVGSRSDGVGGSNPINPAGTKQSQNLLFELSSSTATGFSPTDYGVNGMPRFSPGDPSATGTDLTPVAHIDTTPSGGGTVTGIATLPSLLNRVQDTLVNPAYLDGDMFAVSNDGGLYQVKHFDNSGLAEAGNRQLPTIIGGVQFFFGSANDTGTGSFIKTITDQNGAPVHFTGLAEGPPDVELGADGYGKYAQDLFGIDSSGRIYAMDRQGNLLPIFVNGQTSIATGIGGAQGLAFSPFDYNLWHVTTTRGGDPGHGIPASPDLVGSRDFPGTSTAGGNSFYFGLENTHTLAGGNGTTTGITNSYQQQPQAGGVGETGHAPGDFFGSPVPSVRIENQRLLDSYDVPGGAYGSLVSAPISLTGYTASDKPTLYFDYMLDTQDANGANRPGSNMLDSFRVFASTNGANWTELATNDADTSAIFSTSRELPTYPSVSGGLYEGDKSNQNVQQLFNMPPPAVPRDPNMPDPGPNATSPNPPEDWRQARIDLGDFAGQSNIQLRFDFSSAGSMGTGANSLLGGSYLAAVAGAQLKDGQTFTLDDTKTIGTRADNSSITATTDYSFTLRSGLVLFAPAGANGAIPSGETFAITGPTGTTTYEFTTNPAAILANGALADGNIAVLINSPTNNSTTAEGVAGAISAALALHPVAGVTPAVVGARVQLLGAISVNQIAAPGNAAPVLILEGSALAAPQLQAQSGAVTPDGETFTVTGSAGTSSTFQFAVAPNTTAAGGNVAIPINVTMNAQAVAAAIEKALVANPILGVAGVVEGADLQLLGATTVTQSNGPILKVFGSGVPSLKRSDVPFTLDMTSAQVANQAAAAIDRQFSVPTPILVPPVDQVAPTFSGKQINAGDTFTVAASAASPSTTYEFTKTGVLPGGDTNVPVKISDTSTAADVASAIAAALGGPSDLALTAPNGGGLAITPGELFTINGASHTFEFTKDPNAVLAGGLLADGNVAVLISNLSTAANVATAIGAALAAHPIAGVTPVVSGVDVKLTGATAVTAGPTLIADGLPHPVVGVDPVILGGGVSVELVGAFQLAVSSSSVKVLLSPIQQTIQDDPKNFTSSKVNGETITIYGRNVIDPGPFAFQAQMPGDQFGKFADPSGVFVGGGDGAQLRGQQNDHQGVFIDDIVVGFAGRGEMVTNSAAINAVDPNTPPAFSNGNGNTLLGTPLTGLPIIPIDQLLIDAENPLVPLPLSGVHTFTSVPSDPDFTDPAKILTGSYELDIRRATPYAVSTAALLPFITLTNTLDINDRLAAGFTLLALPASEILDDSTFSILTENAVGTQFYTGGPSTPGVTTFQFVRQAEVTTLTANGDTNILVAIHNDDSAAKVASEIRDAINMVAPSRNFSVKAGLGTLGSLLTGARVNLFGALDVNPGPLGTVGTTAPILMPPPDLAAGQTSAASPSVSSGSQINSGETFTINGVATFEFSRNTPFLGLLPDGNIPLFINSSMTAGQVASVILNTFNIAKAQLGASFLPGVIPVIVGQGVSVQFFGTTTLTQSAVHAVSLHTEFKNYGDTTPVALQGETIIQANRISNTLQAGISVLPVPGGTDSLGNPTIGVPGRTGAVVNLPTLNTTKVVPGVTLVNNLIVHGGQSGIAFAGAPQTADGISHVVPFGRIVNNTIVGSTFGIQVANNASPTILNNVIAQMASSAISIDQSSSTTIVGANIYQSNGQNLVAPGAVVETGGIALAANAPLFVNSGKNNFYLQEGSLAIDSSINTLPERASLAAVTAPLGIPASPIQAPNLDLLGQLRVVDPFTQLNGVGQNVFKDRGAIERADFLGPIATLANPVDNDAAGLDQDPAPNSVLLVGQTVTSFNIQFSDAGVGVDDSTIDISKFALTLNGVPVAANAGFTLQYDSTNKLAKLIPPTGVWANGLYTITLNNSIKDLANNSLQANQPPITKFTIQLSAVAPAVFQNPANKNDVNADGHVFPSDLVIVINDLILGTIEAPLDGSGPGFPLLAGGVIPPNATVAAPPNASYPDVNGDNKLTPSDALQIINALNNPSPAQSGIALSTTSSQSAAPSVADSSSAAAAPSVAADSSAAPIASGLAATSPTISSTASNTGAISAVAVSSTSVSGQPPSTSSQANMTSASQVVVNALATTFASSSWDEPTSELDGILTDLTPDLRRRLAQDSNNS
jgi:hypothetical protein